MNIVIMNIMNNENIVPRICAGRDEAGVIVLLLLRDKWIRESLLAHTVEIKLLNLYGDKALKGVNRRGF